jgi:hypothetical protein
MNAGSTISFVTAYKAMHLHENIVNATPFQQSFFLPVWTKNLLVLSPAETYMNALVCSCVAFLFEVSSSLRISCCLFLSMLCLIAHDWVGRWEAWQMISTPEFESLIIQIWTISNAVHPSLLLHHR